MMKDDNEDDLKNKEDLHIGGMHKVLDIFRFAVFSCSLYGTFQKFWGDLKI